MSESEIKAFRRDLDHDDELYGQYQLHQLIDQTLDQHGEMRFRRKLADVHRQQFGKEERSDGPKSGKAVLNRARRKNFVYVALATAVIIPVVFILFSSRRIPGADDIYSKYYAGFAQDLVSRSQKTVDGNDLSTGVYFYRKASYRQSINILSNYLKTDSTNATALFYLGLSQMAVSDFTGASHNFDRVLNQDFNYYQEHSQWYLGLCDLKLNRLVDARKNFQCLAGQNSIYSDRSSKILQFISPDK